METVPNHTFKSYEIIDFKDFRVFNKASQGLWAHEWNLHRS